MSLLQKNTSILKYDETLGVALGFGIVCKVNGADYVDLQDDHIPEDAMLKAALEFAKTNRVAKVMHAGKQIGEVAFMFPLTTDVAKAMGISTPMTGLLIGIEPSDDIAKAALRAGAFGGFSLGGEVTS